MKKQSLSISIPEPCHENWSEMTPVQKGRHCQSCQKTVVDFTRMPKVKIAEFVSEHEGKMCGRFTPDQLNVELIPPKPSKSWFKYAAILLGLIPTIGYGQNIATKTKTEVSQDSTSDELEETLVNDVPMTGLKSIQKPSEKITSKKMKGRLVDKDSGEPILFGSVAVYHKNGVLITGVETDLDGRFEIEVPVGGFIEASYIGYESKKIQFNDITMAGENDAQLIQLNGGILMGICVVGEYVLNDVESDFDIEATEENDLSEESKPMEEENIEELVKVFPNPTAGLVEISLPDHIMDFKLTISNLAHEIVFSEDFQLNSGMLDLSAFVPGAYVVSVIYKDELIYSEVLIKVQ